MPATITGIVFNDINHNGQFDTGEPGIPNVYVVLNLASSCTPTQTNAGGNYSFTVTTPGAYTIYETVANPGLECPPTTFTQPVGFTMSNGPRKLTVNVTSTQISGNVTISGQNFSHDTINAPLRCNATMIHFTGIPSQWSDLDINTGGTTIRGLLIPSSNVNAIGYNGLDNYIYGYNVTTNNIVRIDNARNVITLSPRPPGLPVAEYNSGDIDRNGFFYLHNATSNIFYTIDLRPNSPTFMKLVSPANGYAEQTSNYGTLMSAIPVISDWVMNENEGVLYGIGPSGTVNRINPFTGQVTILSTVGPATSGALGIDANGLLYYITTTNGETYRYTITDNTAVATYFATTVFSAVSTDATMCPNVVVEFDFGDAPDLGSGNGPDNYNTLFGRGPRHGVTDTLMLGTQITAEIDAHQNSDATGDDLGKGIPDDGVETPLPTLGLSATSYTINVTCTNNTNSPARLYGWLDFNKNGLFETSEAAPVQIIPANSGTIVRAITFTKPVGVTLTAGHTFLRLRLTTDTLAGNGDVGGQDPRSVNPAKDGEVEDYILTIEPVADLAIDKIADKSSVIARDSLTYTITVTNLGPDATVNPLLVDNVSSQLRDVMYSLDGGIIWNPWPGSINLPTINSGDSTQVLITGIVNGFATGNVVNTAFISSSVHDPDLSNNQSEIDTPIVDSANLSIVKTGDHAEVLAGDLLTYSIIVSNAGPNTAEAVKLTDNIPSGLSNAVYSTNNGSSWQPWTGEAIIGNLAPDAIQTILIRGTVTSGAVGTIENTATITSDTIDPDPTNNSSTDTTLVETLSDLVITKTADQNPVPAGEALTYTVSITNNGPSDATNVTISDHIPPNLSNLEYSTDGGSIWLAWGGSLNIGTLTNGATATILIRGTVDPTAEGLITNIVEVTSDSPDPNPENNKAREITAINEAADLSITKTSSPTPALSDEILTYTITISNLGPDTAEDVVLDDTAPTELIGVEFSLDNGATWQSWTNSYNLDNMPNGAVITVLIRGTVSHDAGNTIENTAMVSSSTPDNVPDNNIATETTPVNHLADLSLQKAADMNPAIAGQNIIYTLTAVNIGPDEITDAVITDDIPSVILNPEVSEDGITWQPWVSPYVLGYMAHPETRTIYVRGGVDPATTENHLTNNAEISSSMFDPDLQNNLAVIVTPLNTVADLSVDKLAPLTVIGGEEITYTITITNHGPSYARNVVLIDTIPAAIRIPEVSVDGITWHVWSNPYTIGDMANGETLHLYIRGIMSAIFTGTVTNTAIVTGTTHDPDVTDNTSVINTTVEGSADLEINKTTPQSEYFAGETIVYTLTINNRGPSFAQDVIIRDEIPTEILDPEYSTDGGLSWSPWSGSLHVGTLGINASHAMLLRGTIDPTDLGLLKNTATVESTTVDPDLINNTATVVVTVDDSADMAISKIADESQIVVGNRITYNLTVSNYGPSSADEVVVTDHIPPELTDVKYSLDGGMTWLTLAGPIDMGTILPGQVVILISGMVPPDVGSELFNSVEVSSVTNDPDPSNNTSEIYTPIVQSADLELKATVASKALAGDTVTYTINITNLGPSVAQNAFIQGMISNLLANPQYSTDGGVSWAPWDNNERIVLGNMASGESKEILIRATAEKVGIATSTFLTSSNTPDFNRENNFSITATDIENLPGGCSIEAERLIDVCLPVSVKPMANIGAVSVKCCGSVVITPGTNVCEGTPGGTCDFTARQRICVSVPVQFGAEVEPGEVHADCTKEKV